VLDTKKDPDKQLTGKYVSDVFEVAHSVAAEWYQLGLAMKIPVSTLDTFENENPKSMRCFLYVLILGSKLDLTKLGDSWLTLWPKTIYKGLI